MDDKNLQVDRLAENELSFQHQNKKVARYATALVGDDFPEDMEMKFICECANKQCAKLLQIPFNEYRDVRVNNPQDLYFVVAPLHYLPQFEEVKVKNNNYWWIRKKPEELKTSFEI